MKYVKSLLLLAASVVAILGLSTLVSAKTINTVTPAIDSPTGVTVDSSFSASDKIDSSYAGVLVPIKVNKPAYIVVVASFANKDDVSYGSFYTDAFKTKIDSDTKTINDYEKRIITKATKAGTYYYGLDKYASFSNSVNMKVKVTAFSLESDVTLKAGAKNVITDGQNVMFKYTASKSGITTFSMPNEYGYHYTVLSTSKKALSGEGWTSKGYGSNKFTFAAKKGRTYFIKLNTIETDMMDYTINISEKAVKTTAGKSRKKAKNLKKKKKASALFAAGEKKTYWIKFKQKKLGVCPLTFSGDVEGQLEVTVYCGKHKIGSTKYFGGTHKLKVTYGYAYGKAKKGTYYVKIRKTNALSSGAVTVKYK